MDEDKFKKLRRLERILIIVITLMLVLLDVNENVGSIVIILDIVLWFALPELTRRILESKVSTEENFNDISYDNEFEKEIKELSVDDNNKPKIEEVDNDIENEIEEEVIKYELPTLDLLSNEKDIVDVLQSKEYLESDSKLAFGLKNNSTTNMIDLNDTSHILIAGTTGMGKTALIDNIVTNILYRALPSEVQFLMIDLGNNGLVAYNGIPNLLIPVVTDYKKAAGTLAWIVNDIENRIALFKDKNAEDFGEFNEKLIEEKQDRLPSITIIIDGMANTSDDIKDEINQYLERITSKGKKVGVFLILSTNRPSNDIVYGAIKANIYTRISFFLPSRADSKMILDVEGAEKLEKTGELLFKTFGITKPQKYQCPYISPDGVKSIVNKLKEYNYNYNYDDFFQIDRKRDTQELINDTDEPDEYLGEAIEMVINAGTASTSYIQRGLKIGYSRAVHIIDQMEKRGIISGYDGSKPRRVLITKKQWEEQKKEIDRFMQEHPEMFEDK